MIIRRSILALLPSFILAGSLGQEASGQLTSILDLVPHLQMSPYNFALLSPDTSSSEPPLNLQLQQACASGDLNQVTALLNQGADIESGDAQGRTPLFFAAANGYTNIVTLLLGKGAKIDSQDKYAVTALTEACSQNKPDAAVALLAAGANPNFIGQIANPRATPLEYAALNGNVALMQTLLDHKAEVNYASDWGTALGYAVWNSHWDAASLLLSKGADPNIPDVDLKKHRTPLIQVAWNVANNTDRVLPQAQFLLKAGANPNLKSAGGLTALMYASRLHSPALVQALLDAGTDINITDNLGETALTYAGDRGHQDIVDLLKSKGALRTDLHVVPKDQPDVPLFPARAWALAVGAIYTQRNGTNPRFLGGQDERRKSIVLGDLKKTYDIQNRDEFLQKLKELIAVGERAQDQKDGVRLAAMSDTDFEASLRQDTQTNAKMRASRTSYLKWKEKSGLGFDLGFAVHLVNQGYDAGYLDEKQSWSLLMPLALETQKNFNSWQEFAVNFLDGREIADGICDPVLELCVTLLNNPKDTNSPWTQCPWKTNLSENFAGEN